MARVRGSWSTTHGHTIGKKSSPTHMSWRGMKDRCRPNGPYGKRGIKVCERWRVFINFLADMGERPEGCEIDRKDTKGNYEPDNCQWLKQAPNRSKNIRSAMTPEIRERARALKAQGVFYRDIAAELGVKAHAIETLFRAR